MKNTGGIYLNRETVNYAAIKNNVAVKHVITFSIIVAVATLILIMLMHIENIYGLGTIVVIEFVVTPIYTFFYYPWGYTALYKKHAYLGLMAFVAAVFAGWWGLTGFPPLFNLTAMLYYKIVSAIATLIIFWRLYVHLAFVSKNF